jgi:hypothetical protein
VQNSGSYLQAWLHSTQYDTPRTPTPGKFKNYFGVKRKNMRFFHGLDIIKPYSGDAQFFSFLTLKFIALFIHSQTKSFLIDNKLLVNL